MANTLFLRLFLCSLNWQQESHVEWRLKFGCKSLEIVLNLYFETSTKWTMWTSYLTIIHLIKRCYFQYIIDSKHFEYLLHIKEIEYVKWSYCWSNKGIELSHHRFSSFTRLESEILLKKEQLSNHLN